MLQKIKDYLQEEVDNTELGDLSIETFPDDAILVGRKELAEGLLSQMQKWEAEEEKGTVYTGDAPSTEASFYKKNKVSSATVIDLVIHILTEAKMSGEVSFGGGAMKTYDKIDEAIQELREHLTTVQTEDLDNQAYSEGEEYDNE